MTQDASRLTPYPGLRAYEADENHLFFGRDDQSDELLRRLRSNRFLAVVGTSGSGKSSLVRAGLLPSLYGGFMAQAGSVWRIATLRPGADPIGNLAAALGTPEVFGAGGNNGASALPAGLFIEPTLRRGPLGLVEVTRFGRLAPDENLLVLVDQFEEVFRFARTADGGHKDDSAGFVKLLLEAARQHEIPIYVILTMRSDFLGDCARFRSLPEAINDGQYLVPRLTRDQLREAIVGPAAVGGAEVSHRLIQRLLGEVGDDPDQLPILQHALMRTWDIWASGNGGEGPLDLPDYDATGGMSSALSRHADDAYQELPDDRSREIARVLFQQLSEKSEDQREIRRPTPLGEICQVARAGVDEVAWVVEVFRRPGRSFLMPPASVPLTANSVLDISHESLMRVWTRLKNWVDEEAESAAQYRRLAQNASLAAKGEAGPMTDPELSLILKWRDKCLPSATWAERYYPDFAGAEAFLDRSREERDAAVRSSEKQRRRELRRTRLVAAILLVAFVIVAVFSVFAWGQKLRAEQAEAKAKLAEGKANDALDDKNKSEIEKDILEEQKDAAVADRLDDAIRAKSDADAGRVRAEQLTRVALAGSLTGLDNQFDLALLSTAKAVDLTDQAEFKSSLSLGPEDDGDLTSFVKKHVGLEAKRSLLLAVGSHPHLTKYLHGHTAGVNCVTYSRDGKMMASGSDDGSIILWEVPSHKQIGLRLTGHLGPVTAVSFAADGAMLASGSTDGTVLLWDVASRKQIGAPLPGGVGQVRNVGFSPDGRTLAWSGDDRTQVWDRRAMQPLGAPISHQTSFSAPFAFSPDSKTIALVTEASIVRIDIESHKRVDRLTPPGGTAGMEFSPDGRTVALPAPAGIILFDMQSPDQPRTLPAPAGKVVSLIFSPDGGALAAGFADNAVIVYDVRNQASVRQPARLEVLRDLARSMALSPSGRGLATGTGHGDVVMWDAGATSRISRPLAAGSASAQPMAFRPDGKVLVSGNSNGAVTFWDAASATSIGESLTCHSESKIVTSLAFSPDGKKLASGCSDGTVGLVDVESRASLGQLPSGRPGRVSDVRFSRDGKTLISYSQGAERSTISVWDVHLRKQLVSDLPIPGVKPVLAPNGRLVASVVGADKVILTAATSNQQDGQLQKFGLDGYQVQGLIFSADARVLASMTQTEKSLKSSMVVSNVILLWDTASRQNLASVNVFDSSDPVSFSPDARLMATAHGGRIVLWDVASRKQVGALIGKEEGQVRGMDFSPDGRTLAAVAPQGIMLWDMGSGELLGSLPAQGVRSVRFSPGGSTLLATNSLAIRRGRSGSSQTTFTLWDVNVNSWTALACGVSNRNFTVDEWRHQFGKTPYKPVCPNLPVAIDPDTIEAQSQAAKLEGETLLGRGMIREANAAFMEALKFRPASTIEAWEWNNLCWKGASQRIAADVMKACEFGVALDPDNVGNRDTRGLARALTGDTNGAIQDFQAFVDGRARDDEKRKDQRRRWIADLEAGKNPFTDDLLKELREQQ